MIKIPSSYDIIGNIIILSEKTKSPKLAAKALLKSHKNVKTVGIITGIHKGKYRTRKIKILAGEKTKEAFYKENNVLILLNIKTCYFSPRLASERLRIAKQIKKNEIVLVMFSGVAPYPLVISKNSKAKGVYAVEINPQAHKYAEKNVRLNKLTNIKLYKGDVNKILPKIKIKFDRIIMPLPKTSVKYLFLALKKAKSKAKIHLYVFSHEGKLKQKLEQIKKYKVKILKIIKAGTYAPGKYRYCIDLQKI